MTTETAPPPVDLLAQAQEAIAFERDRADRAEAELAALGDRLGAAIRSAVEAERARAEAEIGRLRAVIEERDRYDAGRLLAPGEVAAVCNVTVKTVTRWADSGKLTAVRRAGGHRRFRGDEVEALRRQRQGHGSS